MTDHAQSPSQSRETPAHGDRVCPQCGELYGADVRFCSRDGVGLRPTVPGEGLIGRLIGERYHVLRRLGHGGMGQVYLAEHVRMKRYNALKVLHPAWANDADALERFHREASNTSRISHPNIASIHDFGETEDGYVYLAMEYIEGESLASILRREKILPPRRVAGIVRQVADALDAAHHLGIVHRDLKPDNIMVTVGREGQDHVKVVDFGIAKAVDRDEQRITTPGLAGGTPAYMSPEQLGGEEVDARTDIYSLGLVIYTMLVGRIPFPPANSRATLARRLTEPPLTLGELNPQVPWPGRLQQVLDQALATERNHRYTTVTSFARELDAAIEMMTTRATVKVKTKEIPLIEEPGPKSRRSLHIAAAVAATVLLFAAAALAAGGRATPAPGPGSTPAATDAGSEAATITEDPAATLPVVTSGPRQALEAQRVRHGAGATEGTVIAPPLDPAMAGEIRAAVTLITNDLEVGDRRARAGEYEGAWVRLWAAERRLDQLRQSHPGEPRIDELGAELDRVRESARSACRAEQEIATGRGERAPQCQ